MGTQPRWTAARRLDVLLGLIRGETTLVDASREHGLEPSTIEGWLGADVTCRAAC